MNVAFSIVLLFTLLDTVMNEKPPCVKGCHVPLTAFYWPVKALFAGTLKKDKNKPYSNFVIERLRALRFKN